MNRFQREVAEMDRRRSGVVRAVTFVGAAVLTIVALWSAGLPPTQWWTRAQAWMKSRESQPVEAPSSAPSATTSVPTVAPAATTHANTLPPGTDSSLATERQSLFLVATSPGRNKHEGTAQIGTNPDNPQTYVAGALLANGARLAEIHRDHVVIARGDASARLSLYSRSKMTAQPDSDLLSVGGERQAPVRAAVTRDVLTDYIRPNPVYDGESLLGYQVYSGAKAGVFARLGLQAGDVITAINDVALSDPHQAMELFNELTRGIAVTATVKRNNSVRRLALDGALILADQDAVRNATAQSQPPGMPAM